jgi:hypothetical protein
MAHGDITAGEVFEDREMLNRLGYGIFDLAWGRDGVGFENVHDFSYVVGENKDPKIYRRKVFEIMGRYYDNDLAKAIWNKFIEHKWVLSEQVGHEIDLRTAAHDWFKNYGHAFLKEWTFRRPEVPKRIRNQREPRKGLLSIVAGFLLPDLRDLLDAGFSVTDIVKARRFARKPIRRRSGGNWRSQMLHGVPGFSRVGLERDKSRRDNKPYLLLKKVDPEERDRYYIRMVANLTGHPIETAEEAEKRWREILEHKWYMSEREKQDVGLKAAALDYYRRLNLIQEAELGQEN